MRWHHILRFIKPPIYELEYQQCSDCDLALASDTNVCPECDASVEPVKEEILLPWDDLG